MGKLGARELNYSSDMDLVLLYDPAAPIYTERTEGDALARLHLAARARPGVADGARGTPTATCSAPTFGCVPIRAVTPPAVALAGRASTYYESMGQNWERAAMIKARPVAGDLRARARRSWRRSGRSSGGAAWTSPPSPTSTR